MMMAMKVGSQRLLVGARKVDYSSMLAMFKIFCIIVPLFGKFGTFGKYWQLATENFVLDNFLNL